MKNWVGVSAFIVVLLAGCTKDTPSTKNLYVPTDADVTATATLSELEQGRELYINSCGECHNLYSPDNFNSSQWSSIMNSMASRTGMNASQISLVKKYVSRGKLQ